MKWYLVVGLGALGGICPMVSKLASSYTVNPGQPLPEAGIYIGLVLFALLGAIVSLGFGAAEVRAAIVAGIAAPAIVTNVVAGAQKDGGAPAAEPPQTAWYEVIGAAHAQTTPQDPVVFVPVTEQILNITPSIVGGGLPKGGVIPFEWVADGAVMPANPALPNVIDLRTQTGIVVPEGATAIRINGSELTLLDLEEAGNIVSVTVQTQATVVGDLKWALGGQRSYQVESVTLSVAPK